MITVSRWKPGIAWAYSLSQLEQRVLDELEDLERAPCRRSRRRRPRGRTPAGQRRAGSRAAAPGSRAGSPPTRRRTASWPGRAGRGTSRTACRASRRSPAACRALHLREPLLLADEAQEVGEDLDGRGLDGHAAQRVVVEDLLGQVPHRPDRRVASSSGSATSTAAARTIARTRSARSRDERGRRRRGSRRRTRSTIATLPSIPLAIANCAHAVVDVALDPGGRQPVRPRLSRTNANTSPSTSIACSAWPTAAPNGP